MTDTRLPNQPHTTVDPAAVHRRHADTVFLADVRSDGMGGYVATAWLPRRHAYYSAHTAEANRRLDPMLLLEACRQVVIYVGHNCLDLAEDTRFLMSSCEMSVPADAYVQRPDSGSVKLTMHVDVSVVRTGSRLRAFTSRCELSLGGVRIGWTAITSSVASPATYTVLRRRARSGSPPPWSDQLSPYLDGHVAPSTVGRFLTADVLLAELRSDSGGTSARMLLPFDHLGLFDHRQDHVPGTLLVEAARQLGAALSPEPTAAVMTGLSGTFDAFVELDAPVRLVARPGRADGERSVEVVQGGTVLAVLNVLTSRAQSRPPQ
ncbi:AfsA-related hotdog domain-containing protein [Micromonospora sp. WMMA1363]|uniref:AfsA-related hotdog domain-containing protein n=1 Tax=Micromonospora sp. WMMA1363 TaxID=3053985 RepID=UPI00259CC1B1|nr:AfsA-related hotdog domain-containing protein [Micromonospora sp. WMMA1363]MDM4721996.1 AfsA-related hotdog domain-containing protein [Micromonospora sp. WMMA1363]